MSDIFELDTSKYNKNELSNLLGLENPFTIEEVDDKVNEMKKKLTADKNVDEKKKQEIYIFLNKVKQILITEDELSYTHMSPHQIITRDPEYSRKLNSVGKDASIGRHTIKRVVSIDSQMRDNYYKSSPTDFQLTLPTKIREVVSMELVGFELPNTFYQISRNLGNHYFYLYWDTGVDLDLSSASVAMANVNFPITITEWQKQIDGAGSGGFWFFISISNGNYNQEQITFAINDAIRLATQSYIQVCQGSSGGTIYPILGAPPLFVIDNHTLRSGFVLRDLALDPSGTFALSCQQTIKVAFNRILPSGIPTTIANAPLLRNCLSSIDIGAIGGIMSKMGWILGFRLAEYTNKGGYSDMTTLITDSSGMAYISEGLFNAWVQRYVYVVVDDFNKSANNFIIPILNKSLGAPNILARITLSPPDSWQGDGVSLATGSWDSTTKLRSYFGPVDITKLKIQVLDSFGRILNINNMNLSLCLNFVCLYDH
jgi:hypothetical protein